MCGFICSQEKINNSISKLLLHRGPDDFKTFSDNNFSIHNYRLSIVDQKKENTHPTFSRSKNTLITFNGEIYNYLEIYKKYSLKPTSIDESHIIAEFFDRFGLSKINELNGMFALVIYFIKKKEIILIRDRFGIKPLNYTFINQNLYASSEIKPLLLARRLNGLKNDEIEKKSAVNFIYKARINHDKLTFFKNIFSLLPGHYLKLNVQINKIIIKRYNFFTKKNNFKNINQIYNNKIKLYSRTKRNVGVLLSGGLDSTVLSTLLKKYRSHLPTFTYCFYCKNKRTVDYDDKISAKKVSNLLKLKNYHTEVDPEFVIKNFDKVLKIIETPFTSIRIFGIYKVYLLAKSKNYPVIFDAQGGDEVFGGYKHHIQFANKIYSKRQMRSILNKKEEQGQLKDGSKFIYEDLFNKKFLHIKKNIKTKWEKKYNNLFSKNTLLQNSQIEDLLMNTIPRSLHYVDRLSMFHSVESRLPIMDNDIVNFGLILKDDLKINDIRSRKILDQFLSSTITNSLNYKKYVADPQTLWLKTYLKEFFLDEFTSKHFKRNIFFNSNKIIKSFIDFTNDKNNIPSYSFFTIFCLSRFMRVFKLNEKY